MKVKTKRNRKEQEGPKEIKITLKMLILIILIVILCMVGLIAFAIYSINNYRFSKNISVKKTNGQTYYVLKHDYTGEYDLQNIFLSIENNENEDKITELFNKSNIFNFNEYKAYCEKWNINQKYTDESLKYIVFSSMESETEGIDVRLADVKFRNNNVNLYLWDNLTGSYENVSMYFVIIPTENEINNMNIIPINTIEEYEYNKENPVSFFDDPYYTTVDKPIIYLYPEKETFVNVKLGNSENLTCSYPEYKEKGWNVKAKQNGDLINLETDRELYSLYYESKAIENFEITDEGFCIEGKDTSKFLEEKLEILGLSEKEAEEFIIYWLPKMQNNKYNYIRFLSEEEINKNMPLEVTPSPESIIRISMIYKGLEEKIEVKNQQFETPNRDGFTVVEWGGSEIK